MKTLFDQNAHNEIFERLDKLTPKSTPEWGQMNVSQMLAHCQFPLQVAMQEFQLRRPNILTRALLSLFKSSLYNDKPWKQGLPTSKPFIVIGEKDFETEKLKLIEKINAFVNKKDHTEWPEHPMFGNFTKEQWGQMQYKHLDHHLKQFGN